MLLRNYKQRQGFLEEAVGQFLGFTRSASDEGAVLYIPVRDNPASEE